MGSRVKSCLLATLLMGTFVALSSAVSPAHAKGAAVSRKTPKAASTRADAGKRAGKKKVDPTIAVPVVGVGPGIFFEATERTNEFQQGGIFFDEDVQEDQVSKGVYSLNVWALYPAFFDRLVLGGNLGWYNNYTFQDEDEDDEDGGYRVGHMFSLGAQGEFLVPQVVDKLNVVVGLRAGVLLAFPSGELAEDLEDHDRTGYSVGEGLPRIGWFAGPHLGFNWPLTERMRVRLDGGVQFATLNLWSGTAESAGITSKIQSDLSTTRFVFVLGPEFSL